jgi:hypothetical protein
MADPVIMCANERCKSISRTLFQVGSVLFAAAAVKIYNETSLIFEAALWLSAAFGLMFLGWKMLILLESET